ncbi:DUF1707 SHOCT-like domain-containing protein [Spirillospora sp. CA-294931]|uniref:DUF1707 SHOCT-like domain-containing protein n=1 Tax=Spirillospora sp. CA-294931 TaxID=3240042 RepID=UPI003D93ABB5
MEGRGVAGRSGRRRGWVADGERDVVVARLKWACGAGVLSLGEYSERVEEAWFVRTRDELRRLVEDLPSHSGDVQEGRTEWHVSPVGGLRRYGRWHMDRHLVSLTVVGGASLDLRAAELAAPEVTLTRVSLVGGVRVCVPSGVRVVLEGHSLLGLFGGGETETVGPVEPGVPVLRIRAYSLLGGVTLESPVPAPRG